jgi:hypothetical protein
VYILDSHDDAASAPADDCRTPAGDQDWARLIATDRRSRLIAAERG